MLCIATSPIRGGLGSRFYFISLPKAPLPGELAGVSPTERLYEEKPEEKRNYA